MKRHLKLTGLPNDVSKNDVIEFFGKSNIIEPSIKILVAADSTKTGEAMVMFKTRELAEQAHKNQYGKNIRDSNVKLYQPYDDEYESFLNNFKGEE